MRRGLLLALATLAILGLGVAGMRLLIALRPSLPRQAQVPQRPLVRVVAVSPQEVPIPVQGFGTVRAKTLWRLVPEVSGRVVQLSPNLRPGLFVRQGELLLEIDPQPFRLAVQRLRAQLAQYEAEIAQLEQQRANLEATLRLARQNLALAEEQLRRDEALARKGTVSPRELDLRRQWRNEYHNAVLTAENSLKLIPLQREKIRAAMAVTRVQLAEAELQLEKTRLVAPFAGQVLSRRVELGEFVAAGQEVARLYDTAAVEVPVVVTPDALRWLPQLSPAALRQAAARPEPPGSLPPATVSWHDGARTYTWQGRVVRWEAGLDPQTHTLTLVVEVPAPWQSFRPGEAPALQPGMFCEVEIVAVRLPNAFLVPRVALQDGDTVFLVEKGTLQQRRVQVARLLRAHAVVTAGLQAGDRVVVSPPAVPVVGMPVRALEVEPTTLAAAETP
ncbi:MAG: hypothetical protein KatS3mg131_2093 [Candidatus Tectimicrobiota bacterium]|nr:MAG: hypothetical protein KatS3mg131_2093 [Candidatus Tectomicrobia bacterium]